MFGGFGCCFGVLVLGGFFGCFWGCLRRAGMKLFVLRRRNGALVHHLPVLNAKDCFHRSALDLRCLLVEAFSSSCFYTPRNKILNR
jgi:hypothetical protein